jgi:exodeoxyribonuclease VII small subunit
MSPLDRVFLNRVDYNARLVSRAEMPRTSAPAEVKPPSYEEALAELERLVQRMEDGHLPLDQMLDSYRRGAELLGLCRSRLAAVEEQVKVLEEGQLKAWSPSPGEGGA